MLPTNIKFDDNLVSCQPAVETTCGEDKTVLDCASIYSECDITHPNQAYKVVVCDFYIEADVNNPSSPRSLKNGSIYGINTIDDLFINIEGYVLADNCEDFRSGTNFVSRIWKLGVMRSFENRGFFRLEWEDCGETYWCYAQVYRNLPIVETEKCNYTRGKFEVQLVVKGARIFKGTDLIKLPIVEESWGCKQNNCCPADVDLNDQCQNNFLAPAKFTITYNSVADETTEGVHINPVTGQSNYIDPTIRTDFVFVKNLTTGQQMKINVNLKATDELCIDGFEGKVYLNGVQLNNPFDPFASEFPSVTGQDEWVLMDATHPGSHGEQLEMCVEYYEIANV